jgi:hypothetical protein
MLANLRHYFARHAHRPAVHLPFTANPPALRETVWRALLAKLGLAGTPKSGDTFRIGSGDEALTGTFDVVNPGRDLGLVVRELDDGLLRFTHEGGSKSPSTWLYGYVIAFGDSAVADRARALTARMATLVGGLDCSSS